jgi:amino acid transporter
VLEQRENGMTQVNEGLVRRLGVWGIWLLAVNGMVGAGIFGVPAGAAALLGVWSPLLFVGCGILLGAVILCFAELAGHFRDTGGPIVYTREAFGPLAGFQTGWAFYVARVTAFAANLNLLVVSVAYFWAPLAEGWARVAVLAAIVGLLAWVNVVGVREAIRAIGVLTVLKFLPLLLLVGVGVWAVGPGDLPGSGGALPGFGDIGTAALLVIYAFVGWEAAVVPAGESRDPARDMPRALIRALVMVTALYVVIQLVVVAVLPDYHTSERALVEVGAILLGPVGAMLLTAGVIVSVGGNVAGTTLTAPRLTFSLAQQGDLPAWMGAVHPRHRTPSHSILFMSALVFALAVYGSFVWLAAMSALVRVLIYMACIGAMPRIRARYATDSSYRVPGGWFIPVAAFLVCAFLLTQVSLLSVGVTAMFLAAGGVIFHFMHRRKE